MNKKLVCIIFAGFWLVMAVAFAIIDKISGNVSVVPWVCLIISSIWNANGLIIED